MNIWDVIVCNLVDRYSSTKLKNIASQKTVILTLPLLSIRRNHKVKQISNLCDLKFLELFANILYMDACIIKYWQIYKGLCQ
jgi:hypothetical protein